MPIDPVKYHECALRGTHRRDPDALVHDTNPPMYLCRDCGFEYSDGEPINMEGLEA